MTRDEALAKLATSAFRRRFHLSPSLRRYVREKGVDAVRSHAADFIAQRLAPAHPANDGRQTPMKGHPVFVAQHATATCCRSCMNKWWKVPTGTPLSESQQKKTVALIMAWIECEMSAAANEDEGSGVQRPNASDGHDGRKSAAPGTTTNPDGTSAGHLAERSPQNTLT